MGTQTVTVELPEEIVALIGSAETAPKKAREMLVLELLRQAQIGQSRAAELLGVSRADILDRMVEHEIPSGPRTAAEVREEFDTIRRYVQERTRRDGDQ